MKYHFISSFLFVIALLSLVTSDKLGTRMMLMSAVLVLFYITLMLFSVDYDKESRAQWKNKEKKLIEETYVKFFNKSNKNSDSAEKENQ
jgi:hypothetical protein